MISALAGVESNCIAFLKRELAPTPERWHSVIRLLVVSAAILVTMQIFRLHEGYWAIITMLIVCGPAVPSSFRKGVERILGTTAGVAVAYVIYSTCFQQPWFLIPAIFACIFGAGLVIVRSDAPYVGWIFALSILVVLGDSRRPFDTIGDVAFEREWVVAIGVAYSMFGLAVIFPANALTKLRERLGALLAHTRTRVTFIRRQILSGKAAQSDLESLPRAVDATEIQDLLLLVRNLLDEKPSFRDSIDQLTDRILLLESISMISSSAIGALKALHDPTRSDEFATCVLAVVDALDTLLADLEQWTAQLDSRGDGLNRLAIDFSSIDRALAHLADFHACEIARLGIHSDTPRALAAEPSPALKPLLPLMALIALVRAMRANYYAVSLATLPEQADASGLRYSIIRAIFGLGLRGDSLRGISFALRLAIAVTISLIFLTATGYSSLSAVMTTPLMIVSVSGGSAEATRARARLRFLGAFAGGVVGILVILVVMPTITSLAALIGIWVLCSAPFFWIMAGGPRVSYFGFQALFCLAALLVGSFAPSTEMTSLGGRVVGIMLGVIVTYVVFGIISPDSAGNELLDIVSSGLRRIGTIVQAGLPDRPNTVAQLNHMRYRTYSLVLRMRVLAASLSATPELDSPGLTQPQVARVEEHLSRLLATANAIAMNRVAGVLSTEILRDCAELSDCASAVGAACGAIADAVDERSFDQIEFVLEALDDRIDQMNERLPEIRLRPSMKTLDPERVERVLGQVGLYHVAQVRMHELVTLLAATRTENQRFRASQLQDLPVHSAQSSTA